MKFLEMNFITALGLQELVQKIQYIILYKIQLNNL